MEDPGTATTRERPLIDAAQQVSHLKDRGVRFELMDEREAERFLRESNFFFKVKAFAKCVSRYTNPGSKPGKPVGSISRMAVEELGIDRELASLTKRAPIVLNFTALALCCTCLIESESARLSSWEGSGRRGGRRGARGPRRGETERRLAGILDRKGLGAEMPEVSRFLGIIIKMMYADDDRHHKPHVHVYYGEYRASIALDGELLAGSLPARQLRIASGWIALHEDELYAAWNLAVAGRPFPKIDPLR